MKIKFTHDIYHEIIMDTDQVKPVNSLIPNYYHKEHWDEMYLGDTVSFGHSTCMWFDGFHDYRDIMFINLDAKTIKHEFDKLEAKFPIVYDDLRNTLMVETNLDFNTWYKENLAYKNRR